MYEVSQLFFFRPLFMAELIVAELMFARNFKLKQGASWRIPLGVVLCIVTAFAIPVAAYNTLYGIFMFTAMFGVTVGVMALVFDMPFKNILCCAIVGFTVQHIAQEFYDVFASAVRVGGGESYDFYGSGADFTYVQAVVFLFIYFQIFFITYSASYWILRKRTENFAAYDLNGALVGVITVLFIFIDVVFGTVVIWALPDSLDGKSLSLIHAANIICCILALVMLFELPRRKRAESELRILRDINRMEAEKYRISKENMDLINLKCHDLKHQIRKFRDSAAVSDEAISELENAVAEYDSIYRTSNEALNIILTEKSRVCNDEHINLSCIIDHVGLGFLSDVDVYALFGNLLDNAIEAVRELDEAERSIGITVKRVNDFLTVHVYNGYAGELEFENGLPVTRKRSKDFHGFGLKSVRHTVERYGGVLQIHAENGIFNVKILFPLDAASSPTQKYVGPSSAENG